MQKISNKKKRSEIDIITKFIIPTIKNAGWNLMMQIREGIKLYDGIQLADAQTTQPHLVDAVVKNALSHNNVDGVQ